MNSFEMTRRFHRAMGLPVNDKPIEPTPSERILRAKLLMEETIETISKGLGVSVSFTNPYSEQTYFIDEGDQLGYEADRAYDPIETLDGLADVKVIANGTAVQFGLPQDVADRLIYESNMSKLDDEGNPVLNHCTNPAHVHTERFHELWAGCTLLDESKPVGKIIKGPNFKEPQLAAFLQSYCEHHTARTYPKVDKMVCGRCGVNVDDLL